jgi:glycine cleavage system protein P-like pyridoxal-binding family
MNRLPKGDLVNRDRHHRTLCVPDGGGGPGIIHQLHDHAAMDITVNVGFSRLHQDR